MPGCPLQHDIGGFWYLWSFGGAQGSASVERSGPLAIHEGGQVAVSPNSPLDVEYRNPGELLQSVCTLLLHFGAPRDLSSYTGILLTASAAPSASFQIELDFFGADWIPCKSQLIEIGTERSSYFVPFGELRVEEYARIQYGLGEKEIDLHKVYGIRVNLVSPRGTLHIYGFAPVKQ